jgi:hypothetical protein
MSVMSVNVSTVGISTVGDNGNIASALSETAALPNSHCLFKWDFELSCADAALL